MKILFSLVVALFAITTATFAQKGVIKFTKESHDFGKIEQGKPVTHAFEFTNTGTDPVIISNVQPQCGCTTPEWTKSAVMPGQKGVVKATYNAVAMGSFNKTVTVTSNAEQSSLVLSITGEVLSKDPQTSEAANTNTTPAAESKSVKKKSTKTSR